MANTYTHKYIKLVESEDWKTDGSAIRKIQEQQNSWYNGFAQNIIYCNYIRNFLYSQNGQWLVTELNDRRLTGRSTQQNNVISPIIRKIVSEQYENDPQPILTPRNSKIPTKLVNLNIGFVENIAYESNTKQIYSRAYHDQLMGWGGFALVEQQESNTSANKVLRYVEPEHGIFGWYWDLGAKHPCKIDGDFAGRFEIWSKEMAELTYPDAGKIKSISPPAYAMYDLLQPLPKDKIVLGRHFVKKYGHVKMVKLEDGAEMPESIYKSVKRDITLQYEKDLEAYNEKIKEVETYGEVQGYSEEQIQKAIANLAEPQLPEMPEAVERNKFVDWIICEIVYSQDKILETKVLPIKVIPQFYVKGDSKQLNGYEVIQPYAANAVTPQRLMNYVISNVIDNIGRSFGTRVVAHEDAIRPQDMSKYMRPGIDNLLLYKTPQNFAGNPMPVFTSQSTFDPNELSAYQQCQQDIKAVLGRYQENLGEGSNAYGVDAIMQRQMNGDLSIGIYSGNLHFAISEGTKVLLEWKKYVYSQERTVVIRGKGGEISYAVINKPTGETDEAGNLMLENDMRQGEFSVEVNGGLSFAAQKYAGMKFLGEMMGQDETLKHDLIDIYIDYSPFAFKNEVNRRLKETGYVNPAVVAQEEGKEPPKAKPNPMEMLAKAKMIEEIKTFKLQNKKLELDMAKTIFDARVKLKEAEYKAVGKIAEEQAKAIESENDLLSHEIDSYAAIEKAYAEQQDSMAKASERMLMQMMKNEMATIEKQQGSEKEVEEVALEI